ncbi:TmrB-like protein (plasmid) [Streptomyces sp. NBC_01136]|uniref:TmrB-like protein n=1 Tax=unclassified Streptomyces TaxID=2593676 RepID=UPI002F9186EF|nr:TmrB-like protein [Streptomyces sp. NBC_01136]
MIVWVNSAFGSGKTTLVDELRPRWPEALVYDPEMVGYVLRALVDPAYAGEIFSALKDAGIDVHHFFLKVPREVLEKRIDGRSFTPDNPEQDERVRRWCKDRIEPCMAAADTLPSDTVVLDGELAPQELADQVLVRVRAGGPSGA